MTRVRLLPCLALALAALCSCAGAAAPKSYRVLVFTKTTGFRHTSIDEGARAIEALGRAHRFSVDTTADAGRFTRRNLARYDAVVFVSTTGTPIARRSQQRAFERYIEHGGGFVGVHAASDTRGRWPWYDRLVGAPFKRHPPGPPTPAGTVQGPRPGHAAADGDGRGPPIGGHALAARGLDAGRRVVRVPQRSTCARARARE